MEIMPSGPSHSHHQAGITGPRRKPYERPRILSREPLEAVAAVCAPAPPAKTNPGLCASGPISS